MNIIGSEYFRVIAENTAKGLEKRSLMIASISQQSLASVSAKFHLSMDHCVGKLVTFFKNIGFDYVFDTNLANGLSLLETQNEFLKRFYLLFFLLTFFGFPYPYRGKFKTFVEYSIQKYYCQRLKFGHFYSNQGYHLSLSLILIFINITLRQTRVFYFFVDKSQFYSLFFKRKVEQNLGF